MRELLAGRISDPEGPLPTEHRRLQEQAEAVTYRAVVTGQSEPLDRALACLQALANQQGANGLFLTGDNVCSPPDSSFTANGLARLVRVCRRYGSGSSPLAARLRRLEQAAETVLRALLAGLLPGGVHTPNHRWEIAAALAELGDLYRLPRATARCDRWLAEGVDLQADGLFSERSPSYACYVSGPCLLRLAELRERPELAGMVHTSLHAHLELLDGDQLETIQSRRQDQLTGFGLRHFAWLYRVVALATGCARCGDAAAQAEAAGGGDPVPALGELLLDPGLARDLPRGGPAPADGWTVLEPSGLAIWRGGGDRVVVRAARDVPRLGRVASGTAANPTFLRARLGQVRLESFRLSRAFFGLGPLRATELAVSGGAARLTERLEACYWQPTEPPYGFEHEGRFAAEMGFSHRERQPIRLATSADVHVTPGRLELLLSVTGASVAMCLEIGLGAVEVAGDPLQDLGDQRYALADPGEVLIGGRSAQVGVEGRLEPAGWYDPGEAYTFLNGTDAVGGTRLYLGLRSPGQARLVLRV